MKKIALLFPGQGSQAVGMGKDFIQNSSYAKQMLQEASDKIGVNMESLLLEPNDLLEQTMYTQPAILLVSMMAYRLFEAEYSLKPFCAVGHSLGEFSALAASGAISDMNALYAVHQRGKWMQEACDGQDAGMCVTLGLSDQAAEDICEKSRAGGLSVWAANYNADGQIVLAGKKADLQAIESELKGAGAKRCLILPMSVASHCPMLAPAAEKLGTLLNEFVTNEFLFPIVSNATAKTYNSKTDAIELLTKQLVSPVLYKQTVVEVDKEVDIFIEFGHGGVLAGLNKRQTTKPTKTVSDLQSLQAVIEELQ